MSGNGNGSPNTSHDNKIAQHY